MMMPGLLSFLARTLVVLLTSSQSRYPQARCLHVLYCIVLYCTVLYCSVQYSTVLYCTVLYCRSEYSYEEVNTSKVGDRLFFITTRENTQIKGSG